jgi:hypothetical protein
MTVDFIAELAAARVLAIIRGTDTAATVAAGKALLEEGVRLVEVSLTTPGAPRAIEAIRSDAPAGSLVGAGTVLTVSAVADVAAAGAQFIVTPAVVESIAEAARRGLPVPDSGRGTRPEAALAPLASHASIVIASSDDVAGRLRRGVTLGAFAVSTRGDWEGLPRRDELALLDDHEAGSTIR